MATTPQSTTSPPPAALSAPTMCGVLMATIAERGDQPALRTPDDSVAFTYAELGDRLVRGAAGLHELGVRKGDAGGLVLVHRPQVPPAGAAGVVPGAPPVSAYTT